MHTDLDDACSLKPGVFLPCPDFFMVALPLGFIFASTLSSFFFFHLNKILSVQRVTVNTTIINSTFSRLSKAGKLSLSTECNVHISEESEVHLQFPSGLARAILASGGSSRLALTLSPFFASRPL
jgi:hypothetical protein